MIRYFQPNDKEQLRELVIASNIFQKQNIEKELIDVEATKVSTATHFEQVLTNPDKEYILAEENGNIVGFILVEVSTVYKGSASIIDLFIVEDFRAQGLGKKLMEKGMQWLQEHGVKKVRVSAHKSNAAAIHLYKEFGFEEEVETYLSLEKTFW